jgi:hypothetical protein|nr:MAG TPA: hypothetical protein [Caudoviricetes sp.]DAQ95921.1 MAG TPA: hypothetical protein [Caudoviricetes sp.]DAX20214.1 MAG TPA: hypothetical protein [Caudoviricetes sp.]
MAEENKDKVEFTAVDVSTPYDEEIRMKYLEAQLADATNNDTRLVELQLEITALKHYRDIYIELYNDKLKK